MAVPASGCFEKQLIRNVAAQKKSYFKKVARLIHNLNGEGYSER